jgi:hypothetical protein
MLWRGVNSKPVEVVGLQLTRQTLAEALEKKTKKTRAGQNGTRGLVKPRTILHPTKKWIVKAT